MSLLRLADQARVAPGFVQTFLERHPNVFLTAGRLGGCGEPVRPRGVVVDSYFIPASPGMDEQQAQVEMLRHHRESWLDSPVCDCLTPREAASAGGAVRAELEAMLDDMQWRNDRNRDDGKPITIDVDGGPPRARYRRPTTGAVTTSKQPPSRQ